MPKKISIVTTVYGSWAERFSETFRTFATVPDAELHAFVYGDKLPEKQDPSITYHLVQLDPQFISTRRDALFRRWTWPDTLGTEYALVVDAIDAILLNPLPPFEKILRGACVAASPEWEGAVRIAGQGMTGAYLNAGVTFWHVPSSHELRKDVAGRGYRYYLGPFDNQTTLNEVIHTRYFDQLTILPSQFNWRANYGKNTRPWRTGFRKWPRIDVLDGVYIYHNAVCVDDVLRITQANPPAAKATLPVLPEDVHPLSKQTLFRRRLRNRLSHHGLFQS